MNKNRILSVLSLVAFVVMADNWVVSPILPAISRDIGVSVASAALIISAYMLPFGLFQLVFGYLGDRFGRIRVITGAMVFFTIGTGLCAIAAGLTDLAIYRALTFSFMCGGSLGTAIGGRIMENDGFISLFVIYGVGLLLLLAAIFISKKSFTIQTVQRQSV